MAIIRLSTVVMLMTILVSSCETEFDPTAPKGSTPYVMCVLNAKDSTQYVRIQRSYITHQDAYDMTSTADSQYYLPENIEVYLTQFDTLDGSIMDDPVRLSITYDIPKDTGLFPVQGHYVFYTNEPIHAEFDYELSVIFPKEDKKITSRITPLGTQNYKYAFNQEIRKTKYSWYNPERIDYFQPLIPNMYQQITRFLFTEMSAHDTVSKYIEYFHDFDAYSSDEADYETLNFLGEDFLFRFIQKEIAVDPDKRRIALGVDFMIQIADSNMIIYQNVGDPSGTYLHSPDFSNIRNGGVGLFASRYKYTIFGKALKPEELDSLAVSKYTSALNFADSKGEFH